MKALIFQGKHSIHFDTVPDPELLEPTDCIVKVKYCSICGSDLHAFEDREKGLDHGTSMGHEFSGEIVDVGSDVSVLKKGDRVMSPFTTNCGKCFYCRIGLTCRCIRGQLFGWMEGGHGLQGGQAEFIRVPLADSTLKIIPEGVSLEEGLMLGDIISTGFFCAHQLTIQPAGAYAVVGCGPVGLMAILGAREYGAEKVFALDSVEERLAMAERLGAIPIRVGNSDPVTAVKDQTSGRGVEGVMEAVGSFGAGKVAYDLVRPGGTISVVGVCTDGNFAFSPAAAYNKNITFKVGRCPARFFMDQLTPLVQKRKYDFTSVFTHRMKLADGEAGYDIFANKKDNCLKVLLECP